MKTKKQTIWNTQTLVTTGMLAAIAGVLMTLEFPVPLMPPFYKLDFGEIPSIIALFLLGPIPAACVEVIKILIKIITIGTSSMYVGDLSNLVSVLVYIAPLWFFYRTFGKSGRGLILSMIASIVVRTAFACALNVFVTLPMYAGAMGISLDDIVAMVTAVNPAIQSLNSFVLLGTIPFNILKLGLNYAAGYLIYSQLKAAAPSIRFKSV